MPLKARLGVVRLHDPDLLQGQSRTSRDDLMADPASEHHGKFRASSHDEFKHKAPLRDVAYAALE